MAQSLRESGAKFLPSGSGEFLRRRAIEAGAVLLGIFAVALVLALLTYNPADPSLNRATEEPATNLLGTPGAITADLLIQSCPANHPAGRAAADLGGACEPAAARELAAGDDPRRFGRALVDRPDYEPYGGGTGVRGRALVPDRPGRDDPRPGP
jgi:hypothetical protein